MMNSNDGIVAPAGLPRIEQYFGPWATEPTRLRAAMLSVARMDLAQHAAAYESRSQLGSFRRDGETAVIDIIGTITKYGSSMSMLEYGAVGLRRSIRRAVADTNTKQILLVIDSPGGSVAGVDDLAEEVARAAKRKPVIAYCEDLCASAAYWVASQAREVYANRSALVGSIGVYSIVYDDSQAAADAGVKVHLIKSAEFKGAGEPGVPVTDEQLADWQRIIDDTHSQFRAAVMRGRDMSAEQFEKVATGQVWKAEKAVKLGLIDGVTTYARLVERAGKRRVVVIGSNSGKAARSETMSIDDNGVPMTAAAYVEKLKGACPGASAEWLLQKAMANAPIEDATAEHYAHLNAQYAETEEKLMQTETKRDEFAQTIKAQADEIEALRKENAELKAEIDKTKERIALLESGVPPIGADTTPGNGKACDNTVRGQIAALVQKRVSETGCSQSAAWEHVMKTNVELRQALIDEVNGK